MGLSAKPLTLVIVLLSLSAGAVTAGLWFLLDNDQQRISQSELPINEEPWSDPLLEELRDPNESMPENTREALGEDLAKHFESFFNSPSFSQDGRFVSKEQPVTWDSSCDSSAELVKFSDLKTYVEENYGLISAQIPDGEGLHAKVDDERPVQVLHLNVYYREISLPEKTAYIQLSLVLGSDPSLGTGYRVERYVSTDPFLADIVENTVLMPKSKRFDLNFSQAKARMESELTKLGEGVVMGTRSLVYGPLSQEGDEDLPSVTVELTGGRITGFSDGVVACEAITETTFCSCLGEPDSNFDFATP